MKLCHKCKKLVKPIIKMGGMLCPECRVVIMNEFTIESK